MASLHGDGLGWDLPPQDHKEWKRQPSVEGKKGVSVPGEEERMLGRYRHTRCNRVGLTWEWWAMPGSECPSSSSPTPGSLS